MARTATEYRYECDRCGTKWTVTDPPPEEYKAEVKSWNQPKYNIRQPWPFTLQWSDMGGTHKWDLCRRCHMLMFDMNKDKPYENNLEEALEAIRLTQEYVMLPCEEGWSWWDFYSKHRPTDARRLQEEWFRKESND